MKLRIAPPKNVTPLTMVEALEECARFLDKSYRTQIDVLQREKEQQVAAQDFDAASVLRDQQHELESYWLPEALRARVLYALGRR